MNVSWILHRDFLEGNKKGHRFTLAVALFVALQLTIPIPLKYPTRVWFLGGGGFTPENTDQKKFVANPWTLEENQRPFMSYKGSFYA